MFVCNYNRPIQFVMSTTLCPASKMCKEPVHALKVSANGNRPITALSDYYYPGQEYHHHANVFVVSTAKKAKIITLPGLRPCYGALYNWLPLWKVVLAINFITLYGILCYSCLLYTSRCV